jgi:UDP-N-acetylglucosamine diphosphorylase/glucosamine-1-phosphate N-acetyltransferase
VTGLLLFDDLRARGWEPFALTRPIAELRFGSGRLVERIERFSGLECLGHITSEHLVDFNEPGAPAVLDPAELPTDRDLLFWCSRAVPELSQKFTAPTEATVYTIAGQPVGLFLPAGVEPASAFLSELETGGFSGPQVAVSGRTLESIWDLVLHAPEQLLRDLEAIERRKDAELPAGVYKIGDGPLLAAADVRIEPGVVFDTRHGPILVEGGVEIRSGTRLAGPAAIGRKSRLLGGSFEAISVGPYSYLRGEVAETVVLGYSNKAHDGYLGHAYVGRWVNLGAFTTNSDLKNNYRPVKVWTPWGVQDSGLLKLGCFLGDHVKTGIGLLLGTGTVVGAGANVYGSAMPPTYVEPFAWGEGSDLGEYRLAEFVDNAARAMARRGVDLDERGQRFLEACWRKGRGG